MARWWYKPHDNGLSGIIRTISIVYVDITPRLSDIGQNVNSL